MRREIAVTADRLQVLDLLRFIAALGVVLYHYSFRGHAADGLTSFSYPAIVPVTKYGFLGVNLFFIISGFVILMTAQNGSARRFFISRAVRLGPAFWFCCTLTCIVMLTVQAIGARPDAREYLLNMSLLPKVWLPAALRVPYIDGAYWSLLVEVQFYALVGLVLALRAMRWIEPLLGLWLVLALISLKHPIAGVSSQILAYEYASYFIAGATFYLVYRYGWSPVRAALLGLSFFGATYEGVAVADTLAPHFHTTFDLGWIVALHGAFFLVFLLIASHRMAAGYPAFVALGTLTYPLYLVHQNIGYVLLTALNGRVAAPIALCMALAVALLLAFLIHRGVERPAGGPFRRFLQNALHCEPHPRERSPSVSAS